MTDAQTADVDELNRTKDEIDAYRLKGGWIFSSRLARSRVDAHKKITDEKEKLAGEAENKLKQRLTECSRRWTAKRDAYRETTFKSHYRSYDRYAIIYYTLTRELEGNQGRDIARAAAIPGGGNAVKEIAEYTGVYDENQFTGLATKLDRNPYLKVDFNRVRNKELTEGSFNSVSAQKPIKFHKTIVMEAFAEGVKSIRDEKNPGEGRVRMKLFSNFQGYEAKKQYRNGYGTDPKDSGRSADERGKTVPAGPLMPGQNKMDLYKAASDMNLVADEKGANGQYLISEKSAKIYEIDAENGQKVKGFFIDGEFFSEDYTVMSDESQAAHAIPWGFMGIMEDIRESIHRSDFFRHVNAGTIQHYMTYNPDDDFDKGTHKAALDNLGTGQNPSAVYLAYTVLVRYQNSNATVNDVRNAVAAIQNNEKLEDVKHLGVLLLSEDDPGLWDIARDLAGWMTGKWGFGNLAMRLRDIPQSGEVMRIALMEEFAKDRSFSLEDIEASLRPDLLNMHIEDLSAKRDSTLSWTTFRQSFWDGTFKNALTGSLSAAAADVNTAAIHLSSDEKSPAEVAFAKSYLALADGVSTLPGIVLMDGVSLFGLLEKGDKGQIGDHTIRAFAALKAGIRFVHDIIKIVNVCRKELGSSNTDERKKALWKIVDLGIKAMIDLAECIIDIIAACIDEMPALVGGILGLLKNFVAGTKDLITIVSATRDRMRISESNKGIDTAMQDLAKRRKANQGAPVSENTPGITDKERMALAAESNAQGQMFLTLARSRVIKRQIGAGFDLGATVLDAAGNAAGTWNFTAFPFKLAGKVTSFIGWCVGKAYDKHTFDNNMARTLGFRYYGDVLGFDEVLQRETGILNHHYLLDLSRIFMAIDTHCLVRNANKNEGETTLAINLMRPYLKLTGSDDDIYLNPGNKASNAAMLQNVKLKQLLRAVGAPDNWRAVLRMSITG